MGWYYALCHMGITQLESYLSFLSVDGNSRHIQHQELRYSINEWKKHSQLQTLMSGTQTKAFKYARDSSWALESIGKSTLMCFLGSLTQNVNWKEFLVHTMP